MIQRFFSLHDEEAIPELLNDYKKTDRLMLYLVFIHWLFVSTFSAYFYGMYMLGFVGGGLLTLITALSYRYLFGTPAYRIIVSLTLMCFTIISIQQNLGRIEMHFHVFVLLAFLSAYKDIRPVTAASILVIFHHLIFNYLQEYNVELFNTPIMVFSYGCGLDIVLLHAFFVIFELIVLWWIIEQASRKFMEEVQAKHKVEELAGAMKQSSAVFENADEGIIITDSSGKMISVNSAYEHLTGYSEADSLGKTPAILKSGRHNDAFFKEMWNTLDETGVWKGEIWNRTKQGKIIPVWLTVSAIYDAGQQVINYIGLMTDMTKIVKANEEINFMAYHDSLTGLPNRDYFNQQLQHAIYLAKRSSTKLSILFIDLDRFKIINDTLGHHVGDEMLKAVAHRIENVTRDSDTLARIGGDEFLLLMENIDSENDAAIVAEKIISVIKQPILVDEHTLHTSASIGVSLFPADGGECSTLIKCADSAMYHAKDEGKSTYRYYTEKLSESIHRHMELENALRAAMRNGELSLVYQPQYDINNKTIIGAEALLRWHSEKYGPVSPVEFIPIAEENHMIVEIGAWVFESACRAFKLWHDECSGLEYISVNISSVEFDKSDIVDYLVDTAREIGIEPSCIELEITERCIMEQSENNKSTLARLREFGFRIAVDDFGTGYSSMSYLKNLPLDTIKIDKCFIDGLPENKSDGAIVKAIMALSESLGYRVVAEGIEEEDQERFLLQSDCSVGQGYLFSKPVEVTEFADLLKKYC
ncbi:MAG: EAL domain-containing protein [Sulfurimonadaceae bacterium]|nr:EAL domain-containing protein [Sulfurimonadaceae bacterium]